VLGPGQARCPDVEIDRVCAGDAVSHLLNGASAGALIVTHLTGQTLIRAVALLDAPAICLVNGADPGPAMVEMAATNGTTLMVSPVDLFETCGRLYVCFHGDSLADT